MLSDLRPPEGESGQGLILLIFMITVFFAIAAVVFDVGLWISERRGAGKDADAAVLAAAQAFVNDLADTPGAFADAKRWAEEYNGVDPLKMDPSPESDCSPNNSCIDVGTTACRPGGDSMPWVQAKIRHQSYAFFASFFGVTSGPDIGASARACVGSPTGHSDLTPFAIETDFAAPANGPSEPDVQCDNGVDDDADTVVDDGCPLSDCMEPDPNNSSRTRTAYGKACILRVPDGADASGRLSLSDSGCSQNGGGNMRHAFHYGSAGTCYVGQDVETASGNSSDLFEGIADRLAEEGLCDTSFGPGQEPGFDEFQEVFSIVGAQAGEPVVPSSGNVFADNGCAVDCGPCSGDNSSHKHRYMPRALDLVLVNRLPSGNSTATITGFTRFYVIGCLPATDAEATKTLINGNLADFSTALNQCQNLTGTDSVLGIPVKSLAPAIDVSNPDRNLPLSIVLVE